MSFVSEDVIADPEVTADKLEAQAAGMFEALKEKGYDPNKHPDQWIALMILLVSIGVRHFDFMMGMPLANFIFQRLWMALGIKYVKGVVERSKDDEAARDEFKREASEFLESLPTSETVN